MKALCVTHVAFEGPARISEWAAERGHELTVARADSPLIPLSLDGHSALFIMGGPMSANDDLPWLTAELRLIESALKQGLPMIGVCLGAQLIAKALGARVYPACKEIGWWPVHAVRHDTPGDDLPIPSTFVPFHWHGETFDIPIGAERLAASAAIQNQAFLFEKRALGLQFHVEASDESVAAIVREAAADITAAQWVQSAPVMLAECHTRCNALQHACYSVLDGFFAQAALAANA